MKRDDADSSSIELNAHTQQHESCVRGWDIMQLLAASVSQESQPTKKTDRDWNGRIT